MENFFEKNVNETKQVKQNLAQVFNLEKLETDIKKSYSINWEDYQKTLAEESFRIMLEGKDVEIKNFSLLVREFIELRKKHDNNYFSSVESRDKNIIKIDEKKIREIICERLNTRKKEANKTVYDTKDAYTQVIFKSVQILMLNKGMAEEDAIDMAIDLFINGDTVNELI